MARILQIFILYIFKENHYEHYRNRRCRIYRKQLYFHMLKIPDYRIICLDCLTYAGNLSTLAPVMDNPNFRFVKESITDREAVYKLLKKNTWYGCKLRSRESRWPLHRKPGSFPYHKYHRYCCSYGCMQIRYQALSSGIHWEVSLMIFH